MNEKKVEKLIRELLIEIGENPEREGLLKTPSRVAKAYSFLTSGYRTKVNEVINDGNIYAYKLCYLSGNNVLDTMLIIKLIDNNTLRVEKQSIS